MRDDTRVDQFNHCERHGQITRETATRAEKVGGLCYEILSTADRRSSDSRACHCLVALSRGLGRAHSPPQTDPASLRSATAEMVRHTNLRSELRDNAFIPTCDIRSRRRQKKLQNQIAAVSINVRREAEIIRPKESRSTNTVERWSREQSRFVRPGVSYIPVQLHTRVRKKIVVW